MKLAEKNFAAKSAAKIRKQLSETDCTTSDDCVRWSVFFCVDVSSSCCKVLVFIACNVEHFPGISDKNLTPVQMIEKLQKEKNKQKNNDKIESSKI